MLGDLADQRLAVALGHPVARLDPLVGGDQRVERGPRPARGGPGGGGVRGAASTSPVSAALRGSGPGRRRRCHTCRPVCRRCYRFSQYCRRGVIPAAVTGWPPCSTTTTTPHPPPPSIVHDHGGAARAGPVADASVRIARGRATPPPWASCRPPCGARRMPPCSPPRCSRSSSRPPSRAAGGPRWPTRPSPAAPAARRLRRASRSSASPRSAPHRRRRGRRAAASCCALGVHPDARRQGHGSRLLNAAVDTLRGAAVRAADRLGAARATRPPARFLAVGPRPRRRLPRPGRRRRRHRRARGPPGRRPRPRRDRGRPRRTPSRRPSEPAAADRRAPRGPAPGLSVGRRHRRLRHQLRCARRRGRALALADDGAVAADVLRRLAVRLRRHHRRRRLAASPRDRHLVPARASATASTACRSRACSASAAPGGWPPPS